MVVLRPENGAVLKVRKSKFLLYRFASITRRFRAGTQAAMNRTTSHFGRHLSRCTYVETKDKAHDGAND